MLTQTYGILGEPAPDWNVAEWINLPTDQHHLERTDLAGKLIYLYGFQSWCPGCHSHGFPTLKAVQSHFADDERVVFVAVQTVFEGFHANTLDTARQTAERHNLTIPFGHDAPNGQRSNMMQAYRTGGTPWTVLIDPAGIVRYNEFHAHPNEMVQRMEMILDERA